MNDTNYKSCLKCNIKKIVTDFGKYNNMYKEIYCNDCVESLTKKCFKD